MPAVKPNVQPVRAVTTFLLDFHEKSALLIRHAPSSSLVAKFIELIETETGVFKAQHADKPNPNQLNLFQNESKNNL